MTATTLTVDALPTEDGEIPCPDPNCPGTVVENDTAVRSNRLYMSGGAAFASTGDGDWQTDEETPYSCSTCVQPVQMPAGFEIADWT